MLEVDKKTIIKVKLHVLSGSEFNFEFESDQLILYFRDKVKLDLEKKKIMPENSSIRFLIGTQILLKDKTFNYYGLNDNNKIYELTLVFNKINYDIALVPKNLNKDIIIIKEDDTIEKHKYPQLTNHYITYKDQTYYRAENNKNEFYNIIHMVNFDVEKVILQVPNQISFRINTFLLFKIINENFLRKFNLFGEKITFSPCGKFFIIICRSDVYLCSKNNDYIEILYKFDLQFQDICNVYFDKDSSKVIIWYIKLNGKLNGKDYLYLFDLKTLSFIYEFRFGTRYNHEVCDILFLDNQILIGHMCGILKIFEQGVCKQTIEIINKSDRTKPFYNLQEMFQTFDVSSDRKFLCALTSSAVYIFTIQGELVKRVLLDEDDLLKCEHIKFYEN